MLLHIIGLILIGLIVGLLGRLVHPGWDKMSLLGTTAVGVASVLIAGLLVGGFLGFIVAIVVGVVLVAAWSHFEAERRPKWRRAMHV